MRVQPAAALVPGSGHGRLPAARRRGVAVALMACLVGVVVLGAATSASAVDAPPSIDLAKWEAQMRQRAYGSKVPGSVFHPSSVSTSPVGRLAGARRSIALSKAATATEAGRVLVPGVAAGTASKFGMVLKGVGDVAMAVMGVDLVYSAFTGGFGDGFGFAGVTGYQSNGLSCDFQTLIGGGCSLGVSSSYIPNGDIGTLAEPGFVGGVNSVGWTWPAGTEPYAGWPAGQVALSVVVPPVFGHAATAANPLSFSVMAALSGQCRGSGGSVTNTPSVGVHVMMRASWGALVDYSVAASGAFFLSDGACALTFLAPEGMAFGLDSVPVADGLVFDYLRFQVSDTFQSGFVSWYPVGHSLRPADVILDPARWWVTTWKCDAGAPHTTTSAPWHETDPEWPAPAMPTCDAGSVSEVTVTQTGEGVETQTLYSWAADPTQSAWAAAYPQCANGSCTLELSRLDAVAGTRLACFDNPSLCVDWFASPTKAADYVCTYAGADVALAECNMYSRVFDQAKRQPGGTIADPLTGEIPAGVAVGAVPAEDTSCPPAFSWSGLFNPWYYYKGVSCALSWAFVPSPASGTAWQEFIATTSTHPPVNVMIGGTTFFTGVVSELGQPGDCSGAPFEMANTDLIHTSYNLCTAASDLASRNPGHLLYLLMQVGIVGGAVWIGFHRIRVSFGGK